MKKNCLVLVLSVLFLTLCGSETTGLLFQYDFSQEVKLELQKKAKIADGSLTLDGKGDFAYVPNSEGLHFSKRGMTLVATVKLNYDPGDKSLDNRMDMFISKGKEFIFARAGSTLYFNFNNGKEWCANASTCEGTAPESGEWAHVAAVVEYVNDAAQGDVGYRIKIYLNGECEITKKILYVEPVINTDKVELGKGFGGGPWFMNGEIANVAMYDHPLNAAEIAKLCSQESRVKAVRKGFTPIGPELQRALDGLSSGRMQAIGWFSGTLRRAAASGYDQQRLLQLALLATKFKDCDLETLAKKINSSQKLCNILLTQELAAMVLVGEGSGSHPVTGLLARRTGREVFGEKSIAWKMQWLKGKQTGVAGNDSAGVTWKSSVNGKNIKVIWTGKGAPSFVAESEISLNGSRMESTFKMQNDSDYTFDTVKYPMYSLAHLGAGDTLVHPYMSGVLVPNPTLEQFRHGQKGSSPSGSVTLQFGAYYNAARDGVYFGFEDGLSRTKTYSVEGRYNNLNVSWENPVITDKGKNNYLQNGKAVLATYRGQWYEAGRIYRDFLEKEAAWWIPELPRKSTPEWFRNNTLWILVNTKDEKEAEDVLNTFTYLRSYFELPFSVHWYQWSDNKKLGWPHYPIKDFALKFNNDLQALGIYTVPYIDSRLWKLKDGPNLTDFQFTSHGRKYAAKDVNGGLYTEDYGGGNVYAVMCPYVKGWQDVLEKLVCRVADYGVNGVYHDQVGTGAPRICHDPTHGHPLNDSSVWLEKGYWPMFDRFFAELRKKHPEFCHTTEENAEPYLKQMDGYVVWRWTDDCQIPLYQSIYSGRAQFVGRTFNHYLSGEKQSFFSKIAQQLVNAEQLGWFTPAEMRDADNRRIFAKKAMHIRLALLEWFNCGRMLAPIDFGGTMKIEQPIWGGNFPQHVKMPVIANSAWEGPDGSRMWLFVNTQSEESTAVPNIDSKKGFWICREGAASVVFAKKAQALKLKGLETEIWVEGSRSKAEAVQSTLRKIASFDAGKPIRLFLKFSEKKITGVPDHYYTPADCSGNLYCNATENNSHFGWIQDGAMISFGWVDFGASGANEVVLKVAVDSGFEGGFIEMLTTQAGKPEKLSALLQLKSTGGWHNFREFKLPLNEKLKGKHQVLFKINGYAACNFASWKYLE